MSQQEQDHQKLSTKVDSQEDRLARLERELGLMRADTTTSKRSLDTTWDDPPNLTIACVRADGTLAKVALQTKLRNIINDNELDADFELQGPAMGNSFIMAFKGIAAIAQEKGQNLLRLLVQWWGVACVHLAGPA